MEKVVKKKRGRPPKNKKDESSSVIAKVEKKKRGRPPKNKKVDTSKLPTQKESEDIKEVFDFPEETLIETAEDKSVEVEKEETPKKKRGRPPKTKISLEDDFSLFETGKELLNDGIFEGTSRRGRPKQKPSEWPQFGFEKAVGKLQPDEAKKLKMFPYFGEEDFTKYSVVKPTVDEAAEAMNKYLISQGYNPISRD